jgi:hypothetical protein
MRRQLASTARAGRRSSKRILKDSESLKVAVSG